MKKALFALFIFVCQFTFGQNKKLDSLLALIKTDKEDTIKVGHLYTVCWKYVLIGEYDKALPYGKDALKLAQDLGFKRGISKSYNNLGGAYTYQGNYPEALKMHYAALKIREEIKDKKGIATSYTNIGIIYDKQGNQTEALRNHVAALKLLMEINDKLGIAACYNNIGGIYMFQRNYPEALKNIFASLKIREELNDKHGLADAYENIGSIYQEQGNYPEALKNTLSSLKIQEEIGDQYGCAISFLNLSNIAGLLKKTKEAQSYANKALQLSKEIDSKFAIKESYAWLTILDSTTNNFKAAFAHHKLYIAYRDSLDNEETQKKSIQATMQYEFDKKEIAAKAEQEKLDAVTREEKQKQNIIIYAVAGILIVVLIFSLFLFNRFRITQRQKKVIEEQKVLVDEAYETLHEKNKEVMDSIYYASRIQRALITSEKYIAMQLNKLMKSD